jgi:hypothetical protein
VWDKALPVGVHMEAIPFIKRLDKVCFIIINIHINNLRKC